jgi:hypothetical protein
VRRAVGLVGALLLMAVVTSPPPVPTIPDTDVRVFDPGGPLPAVLETRHPWQVSADGRYAVYRNSRFHVPGALLGDNAAYLWDVGTRELLLFADHAASVRPEIAADGNSVLFVDQRNVETRRDGVNVDPWLQRIARWDRSTGRVAGLTDFRFRTVVDVALSADQSTVAFLTDAGAFLGPADGSAPPRDVTHQSIDRGEGMGYAGDQSHVSLSHDGGVMAYQNVRGLHEVFMHDRARGTTTALGDLLTGSRRLGLATRPSLCADGSRIAFVAPPARSFASDSLTDDSAYVADTRTGHIVVSSKWGLQRGVETEHARAAVLSSDCHRLAYVAPGEFDGRDFDGNETYKDDVVVVLDVESGAPLHIVKTYREPVGFLVGDPDTLLLDRGDRVLLHR